MLPPSAYVSLPRLALLNLSFNQLKDAAGTLKALRLLPRLRELYLNGNALQGHPAWALSLVHPLPSPLVQHEDPCESALLWLMRQQHQRPQ